MEVGQEATATARAVINTAFPSTSGQLRGRPPPGGGCGRSTVAQRRAAA